MPRYLRHAILDPDWYYERQLVLFEAEQVQLDMRRDWIDAREAAAFEAAEDERRALERLHDSD